MITAVAVVVGWVHSTLFFYFVFTTGLPTNQFKFVSHQILLGTSEKKHLSENQNPGLGQTEYQI